jgi:hypothetical protein
MHMLGFLLKIIIPFVMEGLWDVSCPEAFMIQGYAPKRGVYWMIFMNAVFCMIVVRTIWRL